uniref:Integrase, catalytic core n=1 Tax=Tanacetum cinerariifolium TaxID=118510 RepID=A0A699HUP7_TANCI|nr:integrase, catalytic core [Tanacetum cinerariifolium]
MPFLMPEPRSKRVRTQPAYLGEYVMNLPPSITNSQPESNQANSTALEKNGTWTLKELPEGKRHIDSKWVYKTKFKSNGEVERYKDRLVTKGCTQKEGVDYHETFSPVANLVTVRTLLVVATKKGWIIHQLDVNNAFLHGDLDEEVYMKIPKGFAKEGETRVCRLRKSLYGLKQASRNCIEVAKTSDGLVLSQRKYILDILKDSGMLGCRPSTFPFEQGTKLDKGEEEVRVDATQYRRLVGRLLYLQATRTDVTYAVNVLSQFVSDPRQNHLEAAKRVLRYLKGTPGQGILLPREGPTTLIAYCDSDWLGFPFTRRSRTWYLLLFSGGPISWQTKKQSVVSRSSAEAEYRVMASTVSEILWVRWLLKDMQVQLTTPTSLFCDNQAARHIANNPVYHERTKHVEMDCFFVCERVETRDIETKSIESKLQLADLLTKGLGMQQLRSLLNKMGIRDLHAPS